MLSLKEGLGRDIILQQKGDLLSGPGSQAVGHQHKVSQATLAESDHKALQEKTGKDSAKEFLLRLP